MTTNNILAIVSCTLLCINQYTFCTPENSQDYVDRYVHIYMKLHYTKICYINHINIPTVQGVSFSDKTFAVYVSNILQLNLHCKYTFYKYLYTARYTLVGKLLWFSLKLQSFCLSKFTAYMV